mgnify:CR=1 FL=1
MGVKTRQIGIAIAAIAALINWAKPAQAQEEVLEQWALGVIDLSSEPGIAIGAGVEALDAANGVCDSETLGATRGWRMAAEDTGTEWIELRYAVPVFPSAIEIYESLGPGTVVRVSVRDGEGTLHEVWAGEDTVTACPGVLNIRFPTQAFQLVWSA